MVLSSLIIIGCGAFAWQLPEGQGEGRKHREKTCQPQEKSNIAAIHRHVDLHD